jgi:hypothetical protein
MKAATSIGAFLTGAALALIGYQFFSLSNVDLKWFVESSSTIGFTAVVMIGLTAITYYVMSSLTRNLIKTRFHEIAANFQQQQDFGGFFKASRPQFLAVAEKASHLIVMFVVMRGAIIILVALFANMILLAQLQVSKEQAKIADAQSQILAKQTELLRNQTVSAAIDEINYLHARTRSVQESKLIVADLVDQRFAYWPFRESARIRTGDEHQQFEKLCATPPLSKEICASITLKESSSHFSAAVDRILQRAIPATELEKKKSEAAFRFVNYLESLFKSGLAAMAEKRQQYSTISQSLKPEAFRSETDFHTFLVASIALECRADDKFRDEMVDHSKFVSKLENSLTNLSGELLLWNPPLLHGMPAILPVLTGTFWRSISIVNEIRTRASPNGVAIPWESTYDVTIGDFVKEISRIFDAFVERAKGLNVQCAKEFERIDKLRIEKDRKLFGTAG